MLLKQQVTLMAEMHRSPELLALSSLKVYSSW